MHSIGSQKEFPRQIFQRTTNTNPQKIGNKEKSLRKALYQYIVSAKIELLELTCLPILKIWPNFSRTRLAKLHRIKTCHDPPIDNLESVESVTPIIVTGISKVAIESLLQREQEQCTKLTPPKQKPKTNTKNRPHQDEPNSKTLDSKFQTQALHQNKTRLKIQTTRITNTSMEDLGRAVQKIR